MWQEFVSSTTLHGIRYVFMKRHILIRLIWFVLLLASGGYFLLIVYSAVTKFHNRPINTVVSTNQNLREMDFPAVTICPLNLFAKSKLSMRDDNPLFASSGLNISSCAVTSGVRGSRPCGLSLLCSYRPPQSVNTMMNLPNCTSQYKQELQEAIQRSSHRFDIEEFLQYYSQDISTLFGPMCKFGSISSCSAKDFVPMLTSWGLMCYTYNSGTDGKVKTVTSGGITSGLSVMLDIQTSEYTQGKYSEGFKVLIHGQGEYVNELEGINVGPGQHSVMTLTQKRFKNLKNPYATNCAMKNLKTHTVYTIEGCFYECNVEHIIKVCGCRTSGYKGAPRLHSCSTEKEIMCAKKVVASVDKKSCGCEVPCYYAKYSAEVSYSKFPDVGTAEALLRNGHYDDFQYLRDNLMLLQVGFKSLSYEMQEQQPAYDSVSLFGEIGGSMGLFLGCSLLTICEFFDFLIGILATRKNQILPIRHEAREHVI